MADLPDAKPCLHACQTECGRTYDVIIIQPVDGSTLFYCMPCMLNFAHQLMQSMVEPDNPEIQAVVAANPISDVAYVTADSPQYKVRGFSDPVDDDFFDSDGGDSE
jgi:hypothetical protein